jgi:hypothetical protein
MLRDGHAFTELHNALTRVPFGILQNVKTHHAIPAGYTSTLLQRQEPQQEPPEL